MPSLPLLFSTSIPSHIPISISIVPLSPSSLLPCYLLSSPTPPVFLPSSLPLILPPTILPSLPPSLSPPHSYPPFRRPHPILTRTPGGMAPPPTPIYAFRQKKWTLITTKDLLPGDLISLAFKKRSNNPQVTPTVVDKTKIKNEKKSGSEEQVSTLT